MLHGEYGNKYYVLPIFYNCDVFYKKQDVPSVFVQVYKHVIVNEQTYVLLGFLYEFRSISPYIIPPFGVIVT